MKKVALVLFLLFAQVAFSRTIWIATVSDTQGQLEPYSSGGKSVGGFARVAHIIKELKKEHPSRVLFVSTGDDLMGEYFLKFGGKAIYSVFSRMGVDAVTLGNHEFDRGVKTLEGALRFARFPVVVSNISCDEGVALCGMLRKYLVLDVGGVKIGVIGLITPELARISRASGVKVDADMARIADELGRRLKEEKGADIVVALTHIGLAQDRRLAASTGYIDVICGGHSHDLLREPVVAKNRLGRDVVIVQDGVRALYVGVLRLDVEGGEVRDFDWRLVPVDSSCPEDWSVKTLVSLFKKGLPPSRTLAKVEGRLDLRSAFLRTHEAPVGDMITDAVRERFGVDAAFINSGGIRGDRVIEGVITSRDVASMFPFGNTVVLVEATGGVIKAMLEHGLEAYPEPSGAFLQFSGIRVKVDPSRPPGKRVLSVEVFRRGWVELKEDATYTIAVNSYMAGGGDGYTMLMGLNGTDTYVSYRSVFEQWLSSKGVVRPRTDGRLEFVR